MADLRQDQEPEDRTSRARQGRDDWFSEFLGDTWEAVGDGTYRFVGEQAQASEPDPSEPDPSEPSSESLIEDLSPGRAADVKAGEELGGERDRRVSKRRFRLRR